MSKQCCDDWCGSVARYAKENPVKFFSACSFLGMGAIPILGFLGFALTAVVGSLVGALVLDVFLISAAAVGLGVVLFFVGCVTVCCTSAFGLCYVGLRTAGCTLRKTSEMAGFRLSQKSTWPSTADTKED